MMTLWARNLEFEKTRIRASTLLWYVCNNTVSVLHTPTTVHESDRMGQAQNGAARTQRRALIGFDFRE